MTFSSQMGTLSIQRVVKIPESPPLLQSLTGLEAIYSRPSYVVGTYSGPGRRVDCGPTDVGEQRVVGEQRPHYQCGEGGRPTWWAPWAAKKRDIKKCRKKVQKVQISRGFLVNIYLHINRIPGCDNQVRLSHLWVDFRVIMGRKMGCFWSLSNSPF